MPRESRPGSVGTFVLAARGAPKEPRHATPQTACDPGPGSGSASVRPGPARGTSRRAIQGHLRELYGLEVLPGLVTVTGAVPEEAAEW